MHDDKLDLRSHVLERAVELLPYELAVGRHRRHTRQFDLVQKKLHLPVQYQNYDPMVPYLAPYIEEAKFQIQEEQELLDYHQWDRRMYVGATTGFGDTLPNMTLTGT